MDTLITVLKKLLRRMDKPDELFRFTVFIIGIALITRLAVLLFFWSDWIWQSGEIHDRWNKLAINMVESGTFGFVPNEPTIWRGPIFPLIEIPLYLLFGENYAAWSIVFLLFDTCTCLLLMILGRRLWGNRTALLAGLFHAVYLPVIYYTGMIVQFTTILPFIFLWFYLFSLWDKDSSGKWLPWVLGLISGILILNKTVYLPASFVSAAAMVWFKGWTECIKNRIVPALVVYLLVMAMVVAPWTYRNYVVTEGKFIPVQSLFWQIVWQDIILSDLDATKGSDRPDGETLNYILTTQSELFNKADNGLREKLKGPQKELYEEKIFAKTSIEWIQNHPKQYLRNVLNNTWQFWIGAENLNKTLRLFVMQVLYLGAALTGFWLLFIYRQLHRIRFGLLLILIVWGEHIFVFGWGRFSLDLVPILGIIFGLGIDTWMKQNHLEASSPTS